MASKSPAEFLQRHFGRDRPTSESRLDLLRITPQTMSVNNSRSLNTEIFRGSYQSPVGDGGETREDPPVTQKELP